MREKTRKWAVVTFARIRSRAAEVRDERGDVPGWVMITLMTAGLVAAIWAIAGPALQGLFSDAVDSVSGN